MTVQQIPGENRFYVSSRSRPEIWHVVDLAYVEDGHRKPFPACGCESNLIHHRICPHIIACVNSEIQRLHL